MIALALYLIFFSAFSNYRASKYWPKEISAFAFIAKPVFSVAFFVAAITMLVLAKGWTIGILLSITAYMVMASGIVFFASTNRYLSYIMFGLLHVFMALVLIFN